MDGGKRGMMGLRGVRVLAFCLGWVIVGTAQADPWTLTCYFTMENLRKALAQLPSDVALASKIISSNSDRMVTILPPYCLLTPQ